MINVALQTAIELIRAKLDESTTVDDRTSYIFGVTSMLLQQIGEEDQEHKHQFQELGSLLDQVY